MSQYQYNFKDLTGQTFGRLTVIEVGPLHQKSRRRQWYCKCSCGNTVLISSGHCLTGGNSRSCGCATREATINRNIKHGHSKDLLYTRWKNIKSRCFKSNNKEFHNYGGRGITLYEGWRQDYEAFRLYFLALYPNLENLLAEGQTIDRIDNDGNYEPGNLRVVTNAKNAENKRVTNKITLNGKTQSLRSWWKELKLPLSYSSTCEAFKKNPLKALSLNEALYTCESLPNKTYDITLNEC